MGKAESPASAAQVQRIGVIPRCTAANPPAKLATGMTPRVKKRCAAITVASFDGAQSCGTTPAPATVASTNMQDHINDCAATQPRTGPGRCWAKARTPTAGTQPSDAAIFSRPMPQRPSKRGAMIEASRPRGPTAFRSW